MSARPPARPRRAEPTALVPTVVQGRRLDAVLRAGAAAVGTPVAYGIATQRDEHLTRSLKNASLGNAAATGAPCVPPIFDPHFCNRFDRFYVLGLAITTSISGFIVATAGEYTFAAMAAQLKKTINAECKGMMWAKYFYDTVLPHYGLRSGGPTRLASGYCNDLAAALQAVQSNQFLTEQLQNGLTSGASTLAPVVYFAQLFLYLATGGGALLPNGYQQFNFMRTGLGLSVGVGVATLITKKIDEATRYVASYLRLNMQAWAEDGVRGLKQSPYLNPVTFVGLVVGDDDADDNDEYVNPLAGAGPPPLEQPFVPPPQPEWLRELKERLAVREAAKLAGLRYDPYAEPESPM